MHLRRANGKSRGTVAPAPRWAWTAALWRAVGNRGTCCEGCRLCIIRARTVRRSWRVHLRDFTVWIGASSLVVSHRCVAGPENREYEACIGVW